MTNYDQALAVLEQARRPGKHRIHPHDAVEALADAGLLAPDLPRPDRDGRWWPTAASIGNVNINPAGEIVLHSGNFRDMTLHLTPAKARDLANILNAAANHTTQEKK